jgi:hypothetical protein
MDADQGFRKAPGSLLRIAAGAGAAALIVTAVSAVRRAGTAMADRDSGPAQGSRVPPSAVPVPSLPTDAAGLGAPSGPLTTAAAQTTPDVRPSPAAPEPARSCDLAGQVAISAALLLFSVTALPAMASRRRAGGRRGAAHARTSGRGAENGNDALPRELSALVSDPSATGAPRSGRPDAARHHAAQPRREGQRSEHADDYPSWPGRPGPYALHPDHPSWGGGAGDPRWDATEQVLRQDGYPSWPEPAAPPWREGQRSQHADDYPSWPGRPGPYALHPDHPSWGGGAGDPRWDATEQVLRQDGYPSWPEPTAPPWRDAERPTANNGSGWRGGGIPARPESRPAPHRGAHGRSAMGQSATGPRQVLPAPVADPDLPPRAGYAPRPGTAPHPYTGSRPVPAPPGNVTPGPGPMRQAGYAPGPGPAYAPGPGPAPQAGYAPQGFPLQPRVQSEVDRVLEANRGRSSPGQIWDPGSVEFATRIISEANQQAAEIRHEARDDAATARADAKQEAAKLVQQAADQAAATLAAAELQAARVRAEILKLSTDLGGVATGFTESLLSPAKPAAKPAADPAAKPKTPAVAEVATPPAAEPAAKPAARPAAEPAAKPAKKPATRSASAPATRPGVSPRRMKPEIKGGGKPKNRQVSAARKVAAAFIALAMAGAATGATELALHGPAFFVFRANGAGASQTGPKEDQGPGQPDAPVKAQQPKQAG